MSMKGAPTRSRKGLTDPGCFVQAKIDCAITLDNQSGYQRVREPSGGRGGDLTHGRHYQSNGSGSAHWDRDGLCDRVAAASGGWQDRSLCPVHTTPPTPSPTLFST